MSRKSSRAALLRVAAFCLLLPGPIPAQDHVPDRSPSLSSLIVALQAAEDPRVRRDAAFTLSALGSPAAVGALRASVSDDPDPSVRSAAAGALGSMGFQARSAVTDLIGALQDAESPSGGGPPVCSAAATALGELGRYALSAVEALAGAGAAGCGDLAAVTGALTRMAGEFGRIAPSLSPQEQRRTLGAFQDAGRILEGRLSPEALRPLDEVRRQLRARRLGWMDPVLTLAAVTGATILSAASRVSGILAGTALLAILLLLMRNAKSFLPQKPRAQETDDPAAERLRRLEDWLSRPGAIIDRLEATPISMVYILKRRAEERGLALEVEAEVVEEAWEGFIQSARGGVIPSSAAAFWVEDTLRKTQEGKGFSPPASIAEAAVADVRHRAGQNPEGPREDAVEEILQALAWETVKSGRFSGWIPLDPLAGRYPDTVIEEVLAHAEEPMGALKWDRTRSRIQFVLDVETTARLGTRHLLTTTRAHPELILTHLGKIHREAGAHGNRRQAAAHLRMVARALLDVAHSLEEDAPDLGIAEEALASLAASGSPEAGSEIGPGSGCGPHGGDVSGHPTTANPAAAARLQRLLRRLDSETHPSVRERIIGAMGSMGPEARPALPFLLNAVDKEPPGVALAALDTVGRIGPGAAKATPLLMEVLEKGRPMHRLAATRALGRIGSDGEVAAPTLLSWVSKDGVPHELRVRSAEALGGMPGYAKSAVPTLTELLRSPVAAEVQQAAILALARLDTGSREVDELFARARKTRDPALEGMLTVAVLVREDRLGKRHNQDRVVPVATWAVPMTSIAGALAALQLGAVAGSELLSPGNVLPALFLGPAMAFMGGMVYAVITRRLPMHPALGSGVTGWGGASAGLLLGFLVSSALSPLGLVVGGGLALGSGAFGGVLVHTALTEL